MLHQASRQVSDMHSGRDPSGVDRAALRALWFLLAGIVAAILLTGVALGAMLASASPSGAVMADGMTASGGDRAAALLLIVGTFLTMAGITVALWRQAGRRLLSED